MVERSLDITVGLEFPKGTLIQAFAKESNRIEGLDSPVRNQAHTLALRRFLALEVPSLKELEAFVKSNEPSAQLRDEPGLDVRVGDHLPPPGGPVMRKLVQDLCWLVGEDVASPYKLHVGYESLHPFTDCNGRSGRALWAWQMWNHHGYGLELGFLHKWYYQSLDSER